MSDIEQLNKWRLLLGKYSENQIGFDKAPARYVDMDEVLDFLYSREYGEENDMRKEGSTDASQITVSDWINKIRILFPKETVEIMERHALDNYGMSELLTDKEVLEKLEPNKELLKTILQLKGMMKKDVLDTAKKIIQTVVDDLTKKLENDMKKSLLGRLDKNSSSPVKSIRNLDIRKTIKTNMKNYDIEQNRIVLEKIYFNARVKRYNKYRVIIAVDESGSMLDSIIHSAIMAGIFAKLPMLDTKLVIFDTQVVDLSDYIENVVETLMSVQLGGGTNINGALSYCEKLIENPYKTILVLVSDLYEGMGYNNLFSVSSGIIESGAKFIVLPSLDMEANPSYDKNAAKKLADMGAYVGCMTPRQLSDWIGKIIS